MEKILIKGSSDMIRAQIEKINEGCGELKHVSVYFENYNFIYKKYRLLSNGVHMILEFEKKEVQIESANCGYGGGGPSASVSVLAMLGLNKRCLEELIYYNDAVDFYVDKCVIYNIDTSLLFYPGTRDNTSDRSLKNKIERNKNVSINLETGKVLLYNPQRTCWNGFLNLLSFMEDIQMEYYIGSNSPLEGGLYIGKEFGKELRMGNDRPDVKGTEHVNLCLTGSNFSIACLIDRKFEVQVIESVYLALTGECLFKDSRYPFHFDWKKAVRELFWGLRNKSEEYHDIIDIRKEQTERRK